MATGAAVSKANTVLQQDYRVIVGLGLTGFSCARFFNSLGLHCVVVDTRKEPAMLSELRELCPDIEVFTDGWHTEILEAAAEIIVSPGVSLQEQPIKAAQEKGVPVSGDIDLFARYCRAPVIAITGSNGKSTVTALLGAMASATGKVVAVGGNIGVPALDILGDEVELYVLELSSFQLERCHQLRPAVATILNLSPDHIDRHKTLEDYKLAKLRIYDGAGQRVCNRGDENTAPLSLQGETTSSFGLDDPGEKNFGVRCIDGQRWLLANGELLVKTDELQLKGDHNIANALAALALGELAGLPMATMIDVLIRFEGLQHRSQQVATVNGVTYINDSKATNVGAAVAALQGLHRGRNIVLIAGGQGKDADFSPLVEIIQGCCRAVVLMGESATGIAKLLPKCLPVSFALSMDAAVSVASQYSQPGDIVLLSPACASFDMFEGFEDRGHRFVAAIAALKGGAS